MKVHHVTFWSRDKLLSSLNIPCFGLFFTTRYSLFWINIFLCRMLCSVWGVKLKPKNLISCGPSTSCNNNFLRYLHSFPRVLFYPSHISSVVSMANVSAGRQGSQSFYTQDFFSPCISVIPYSVCTSVSNPLLRVTVQVQQLAHLTLNDQG